MDTLIPPGETKFKYDPLPDTARYIRLLRVVDNNYSTTIKIRCKMTTWPIDNIPPYHAISYTWGEPKSNTTILVNNQAFSVRKNCEFVLRQAYSYHEGQYYWVDSVCIDQDDGKEKGTQVSIMDSIYKKAAHMLACVGDHADDSRFLFQKLEQFSAAWINSEIRRELIFDLAQEVTGVRRFLWAAVHFTQRPYFTRLWVLQEQRHAKQTTFLCGPDSTTKESVRMLGFMAYEVCQSKLSYPGPKQSFGLRVGALKLKLGILNEGLHSVPKQHRLVRNEKEAKVIQRRLRVTRHVMSEDPLDRRVSPLLDTANSLQCADKRNKIYGIISVLDWHPVAPIIPDYTKSDFEIYVDFMGAISRLRRHRQGLSLRLVSQVARRNLEINIKSDGVFNALEARRVPSEDPLTIAGLQLTASPTPIHSEGFGYRILGEHLFKSPKFSIYATSTKANRRLYLPHWVRDGDWIVFPTSPTVFDGPILVRDVPYSAREADFIPQGGGPIIGRGFCETVADPQINKVGIPVPFGIYWHMEDMIFNLDKEWWCTSEAFSHDWIKELNTGVCRTQMIGSSYAKELMASDGI